MYHGKNLNGPESLFFLIWRWIVVAKLTAKQALFVAEYMVDLNATAAARRAGYSYKNAEVIGYQLLQKPLVKQALQAKMKKMEEKTEITIERVLKEYAKLAFYDPRQLFCDDGSPKDTSALSDDVAAAIAGLDVVEIYEGEGRNRKFVGYIKKYRLADKKGALDSIGKHLGMFVDRQEHSGPSGKPIEHAITVTRTSGMTPEEKQGLLDALIRGAYADPQDDLPPADG